MSANLHADYQRVLHARGNRRFRQVRRNHHRVTLAGVTDVDRRADHADRPVAGGWGVDEHHLDVVQIRPPRPCRDTPPANTLPRKVWVPSGDTTSRSRSLTTGVALSRRPAGRSRPASL